VIAIVITSYGEPSWRSLAWERAYPSTIEQGAEQVIVHHSTLETIGPARNEAAAQAEEQWLIFLDADDELAPGYVEAMRRALRREAGKVLFQPAVLYLRQGRPPPKPIVIADRNLRKDNYLVIGTMVNRRQFHQVGGFSDYHHGFEDWSLWVKCWQDGARIVPVPEAVYRAHYNHHSKHRLLWRDRKAQAVWHQRIEQELFGNAPA